ncbi:hypothetical protein D3C81_2203660 [compost metagenome]
MPQSRARAVSVSGLEKAWFMVFPGRRVRFAKAQQDVWPGYYLAFCLKRNDDL